MKRVTNYGVQTPYDRVCCMVNGDEYRYLFVLLARVTQYECVASVLLGSKAG